MKLVVFYPGESGLTSIRRVTEALVHSLPDQFVVKEYTMPGKDASLKSMLRNIIFVWKRREKNGFNYLALQSYAVLGLIGVRKIITIHDLNPIYGYYEKRENKWYYKLAVYLWWIYLPVVLTNRITCVSNFTREQLYNHVSRKHVEVIYNMLHSTFLNLPFRDLTKSPIFSLLIVGTSKHKNVENIFRALRGINIHLNVLGKLSIEQREMLTGINYSAYCDLDDEAVLNLYRKSDIVVFISVSEGFGMPIIEAQAAGCALVCSNVEPMMEIAGNGALYVDPFDIKSIHDNIIRLMSDKNLLKKMIRLGYQNIERFAPEIAVQKFMRLLQ